MADLAAAHAENTEQLKNLIAKVDNHADDLKQSALQTITTIDKNIINFFVNPLIGSNNNSGTSNESPFKTLDHVLTLVESPIYTGRIITISIEPGEYQTNRTYKFVNRNIVLMSTDPNNYASIKITGYNLNGLDSYLATHAFELHDCTFSFIYLNIYTPLLTDVTNNGLLTSTYGGLIRPNFSSKTVTLAHTHIFMGDQYLFVPSPGDNLFVSFTSCEFTLRPERTLNTAPIYLLENSISQVQFYVIKLNSGLSYNNGSLFDRVIFDNGKPRNLITNQLVGESVQ